MAARADVSTSTDHCGFHSAAPPVAAAADAVADHREEGLLELGGNGPPTYKKGMNVKNPQRCRRCSIAVKNHRSQIQAAKEFLPSGG